MQRAASREKGRDLAGGQRGRRASFLAQTASAGFEVFNAIDLRRASDPVLHEHVDLAGFEAAYGRRPHSGEVGCLASHLAVIKSFAEEGTQGSDRLVVCEDDAELLDGFDEVIASRFPSRLDLVVLGFGLPLILPGMSEERSVQRLVPVSPLARRLPGGRRVGLALPNGSMGMVGYTLTADAARRITRVADAGVSWTVDDFAAWQARGISAGLVHPGVVRQCGGAVSTTVSLSDDDGRVPVKLRSHAAGAPTELELRARRIASDVSRPSRRMRIGARLLWLDSCSALAHTARRVTR